MNCYEKYNRLLDFSSIFSESSQFMDQKGYINLLREWKGSNFQHDPLTKQKHHAKLVDLGEINFES